ncbi:hypothetical protein M569_09263 [Genlisea aurea]|uniref:Uncharacterized protein n=1 Tax=Genlisea aurea TaxID=192259 RepID=S8CF73_9LAMI|nr:hypothetical protein M569_09263 [Genlisea aurea]
MAPPKKSYAKAAAAQPLREPAATGPSRQPPQEAEDCIEFHAPDEDALMSEFNEGFEGHDNGDSGRGSSIASGVTIEDEPDNDPILVVVGSYTDPKSKQTIIETTLTAGCFLTKTTNTNFWTSESFWTNLFEMAQEDIHKRYPFSHHVMTNTPYTLTRPKAYYELTSSIP